ncbi:Crp/Fnr family transcriptional regulator [Streptomyces noboritoensis]|uniref:Crp/Fnr family transcriptional regulator n=1 Tax=Streptomyces noboritoensis TaxID=67337 RepID=A0ABV6TGW6_9ACTN
MTVRPRVRLVHRRIRAKSAPPWAGKCSTLSMIHGSETDEHVPFLDMLPEAVRTEFQRLGSRRCYALGDILIREGDRGNDLVLLHKGLVKVTARGDGDEEALMDIWIAGHVVGEMAAVDDRPRSATVTACGDVVATVIPQSDLQRFLAANPEASMAFYGLLCGRLRRANRWRLEFRGHPVGVRVARMLVELALSYGRRVEREFLIDVNLTQAEFAALTGSTPHTVHKALARLRKAGLITTGCRRTNIRDLDRLRVAARLSIPVS